MNTNLTALSSPWLLHLLSFPAVKRQNSESKAVSRTQSPPIKQKINLQGVTLLHPNTPTTLNMLKNIYGLSY